MGSASSTAPGGRGQSRTSQASAKAPGSPDRSSSHALSSRALSEAPSIDRSCPSPWRTASTASPGGPPRNTATLPGTLGSFSGTTTARIVRAVPSSKSSSSPGGSQALDTIDGCPARVWQGAPRSFSSAS